MGAGPNEQEISIPGQSELRRWPLCLPPLSPIWSATFHKWPISPASYIFHLHVGLR